LSFGFWDFPEQSEGDFMSVTDPIADFLTHLRNSSQVGKEEITTPSSKIKVNILQLLKKEGFIEDYSVSEEKKGNVKVKLKYHNGKSVISGIRRISKPSLRVYVGKDELPEVYGGIGTAVISTSQGILTSEVCREKGFGGEVICYIW